MQNEPQGLGNKPIIVILGLIATLITIIVFLTGKESLPQMLSPQSPAQNIQSPNVISTKPNPEQVIIEITREVILTATPQTVFSPTPKYVPKPTDIVIANPTKADTPSNSLLSLGETWTKDGLSVRLTEVEPGIPGIRFSFVLENSTESTMYFGFDTGNVTVTDNNGKLYSHKNDCKKQIELDAGKSDYRIETYCPGGDALEGDLFDTMVQFFMVTVTNLGRIDNATWKVPVPR